MGKFNKSTPGGIKSRQTTNLAGGTAYSLDTKTELAHLLLTSMMNGDKFYEKESDSVGRLKGLIDKIPLDEKDFAAKAAIYARDRFGLRSVSHITAAHIARTVKGEEWTKYFFDKVCVRADDPLEILSAYRAEDGSAAVPNSMKKGFAKFLERQSEHSLAKYRKDNAEINMYDLVNLVHPRDTKALKALMTGTLKPADTWETKMTQIGQAAESEEEKAGLKADAWASMLETNKLGYMACLRNLRNIASQCDIDTLTKALELLVNVEANKRSRVFPFRFLTAYKLFKYDKAINQEIDGSKIRLILKTLSDALEISFQNIPKLPGKTLVAIDYSGSMNSRLTQNPNGSFGRGMYSYALNQWKTTDISLAEAAMLLGVGLAKFNNSDVLFFADKCGWFNVDLNSSVIQNVEWTSSLFKNGGTDWNLPFLTPLSEKKTYDRIITFSDEQGWICSTSGRYSRSPQDSWKEYRAFSPSTKAYLVDMTGYGTTSIAGNDVANIAGFSEKIFEIMSKLDTDPKALVHEIEAISLL